MALGALVGVVSFLGFPRSWDTAILAASGFFIVVLTLLLRRDFVHRITHIKSRGVHGEGDFFSERDAGSSPASRVPETTETSMTDGGHENSSKEKTEN